MTKPLVLHMLTSEKNLSPFDVNMAIDAGWEHTPPYTDVEIGEVQGLVQDAIFSRGPSGVKRTGLFIGGRDMFTALEMLEIARNSMVPPFEVSVFADPSGAFTTAAGMVGAAAKHLITMNQGGFDGKKVLVLGGTGPVGVAAGILADQAGAEVFLISRSVDKAGKVVERCKKSMPGLNLQAGDGKTKSSLLSSTQIVFGAAAAGVEVMSEEELGAASSLLVATDVNAVPPSGIAQVEAQHDGVPIQASPNNALGIGALAVGNIKYQVQQRLLKQMYTSEKPVYLHFAEAYAMAKEL